MGEEGTGRGKKNQRRRIFLSDRGRILDTELRKFPFNLIQRLFMD